MKLLNIRSGGSFALGVKTQRGIVNVSLALAHETAKDEVPRNMQQLIRGGEKALSALEGFLDSLEGRTEILIAERKTCFAPAVLNPGKIICIGLNYREHAEETKSEIPQTPIVFSKFNNAIGGHEDVIMIPPVTKQLDYEAELAIVIGKRAKNVSQDEALEYVFGYTCSNDISARDLQRRSSQWLLGKTCDGFCPLGPYLVTADEIGDPNALEISSTVNGEQRQASNTSDMIFSCAELISYISHHMTLQPGDVILTGTPAGVIIGYPKENRVWLKDGDIVSVEIEKIGKLTNKFRQEN